MKNQGKKKNLKREGNLNSLKNWKRKRKSQVNILFHELVDCSVLTPLMAAVEVRKWPPRTKVRWEDLPLTLLLTAAPSFASKLMIHPSANKKPASGTAAQRFDVLVSEDKDT